MIATSNQERIHKTMLWTLGYLDILVSKGYVDNPSHKLTDKGRALFQSVVDEGFEPMPSSLKEAMKGLEIPDSIHDDMITLINEVRRGTA